MAERIELLRGAAVFGGLDTEALRLVLARSTTAEVREGEHFFEQGERGDALYVLVHGVAGVYKSSPTDDRLVRLL